MERSVPALTIGELARAAEVGVETIRFYERKGLVPEPPRRRSGYRQYPPQAVQRVRFIRRAKELGFTLREIQELLSFRVDSETACADVLALARAKIEDIEARMAELDRMKRVLERLARTCRGSGASSDCAILDLLEDEERRDAER